jgi:hypothetical protein
MNKREHFPHRLYEMLEYAADCGHPSAISWTDDGRGFTIHQKDKFLEYIVPVFFKQTKYRSFVSQPLPDTALVHVALDLNRT